MKLADALVYLATEDSALRTGLEGAKQTTTTWAGNIAGVAKTALVAGVATAGAAAAGAVIAIGKAAFDVSGETKQAARDMAASLGLPISEAEKFAEVAKRVYGNNFAESVGDAAGAVTELAKQLGVTADDPALQTMAENAFRLRDTFGVDVAESINAVKSLTENFGISSAEAFDQLAAGYQRGLDSSGDLLDTIGEYSNQFAAGGASAAQFFSALDTGLAGGMLGTDKAADAFKEFRLRIQDGSQLTADSLAAIGLSAEQITAGLSSGTLTVVDVFGQVQAAMLGTEDPIARFNAGVGLLGSQYEDLGEKTILAMDLTNDWAKGTEGAITSLDAKYGSFGEVVSGVWRRLVVSVTPFTDKLLELVNSAMPAVMGEFDRFDATVGPAMEQAGQVVGRVVEYVRGLFGQFGQSVDSQGTKRFAYFKEWLDQNMPRVQQIVETVLGAISGFWTNHGDAIMHVINNTFSVVFTIIDTVLKNVLDLVTVVLQVLTGDWEGAGQTLLGIVQRTWDTVSEVFRTQIDSIKTIFTDFDWAELGRNIVQGMIDGIVSMSSALWEAARQTSQNLWNQMTGWWNTGSPSRKAKEGLGIPIAQGIGLGIQTGIDDMMRQIDGSMGGLFGGLQGATPAQAGAGAAAMQITVYVSGKDASYESGRAVGRGILDELRSRGGA